MKEFQETPARLFYDFRLDERVPPITCSGHRATGCWRRRSPTCRSRIALR
jgi:hypothetical protein